MNTTINHNVQRKAAVINDFTSFGRCSLAVTIPILSAMKVQCCPVPTAFFTNHTGFPSFAWTDNTPHLDAYIDEWRKLGLRFNAIQTGFLGSREQVDFVLRFLSAFRAPETVICVDPVMGDYGRLYPTYDTHLAESMRGFLDVADILTPNLTEACFLADEPYRTDFTDAELAALCAKIDVRHAARIVISGIPRPVAVRGAADRHRPERYRRRVRLGDPRGRRERRRLRRVRAQGEPLHGGGRASHGGDGHSRKGRPRHRRSTEGNNFLTQRHSVTEIDEM